MTDSRNPAAKTGNVTDRLIPAKNPPALIGYYLGVFSVIPCLGLLLGPPALVTGIIGMRRIKANPELPGKTHAIVAIVLGSLTSLFNFGFFLWPFVLTLFHAGGH